MEIRGSDLLNALSRTYATASSTSASSLEGSSSLLSSRSSESLDISMFGKLRSAISGMSDEEKEEVQSFHAAMMEAVQNGTFDAAEMASSAPDALKSFAEENGIDLEAMLEKDAAMMKSGPPPGPPPMMAGGLGEAASGMSDEEEEELMSFVEEMMKSVEDGTFDAAEMASSAPESLKSYAEENGIDLESALEDQAAMMEKMAAQGPPPPPPPSQMYGSDGYGTGYSSQELSLDLLAKWASEEREQTSIAGSIGQA